MVDAHPEIAITPETHWLASFFTRQRGLTPDGLATPKLIRKLLAHPKFFRLGFRPQDLKKLLTSEQPMSYARFVTRLFDAYGQTHNKTLVGDKTPGYARELRILHRLWPQARFIHLIRDGRDVCLSAINWTRPGKLLRRLTIWHEDRVTTAALWWEWHVRLCRQAAKELPPGLYCEIRYEALVARPEEVCTELCKFLGVPYAPGMVRFHELPPRSDQTDHAWMAITPGLRNWRREMLPFDLSRFEATAGSLLDELGYARGSRPPDADRTKEIGQLREVFLRDTERQRFVLPDGW
jgi:hypothetical protein